MTRIKLGINTCFTATRWPRPEDKFRLVRELGLDTVQYSLDGFDAGLPPAYRDRLAGRIREAAETNGVAIHSTMTGADRTRAKRNASSRTGPEVFSARNAEP